MEIFFLFIYTFAYIELWILSSSKDMNFVLWLLSSCSLFILFNTWNLKFNLYEINISSAIYFCLWLPSIILFSLLYLALKKNSTVESTFLIINI